MGKRSTFQRRKQDRYLTFDRRAGQALAPHLTFGCRFWEPCAGRGDLVDQLQSYGAQCVVATDIQPEGAGIFRSDALQATREDVDSTGVTHIITNPPWTRDILHQMIWQFMHMRPTWLLFDADWPHTIQDDLARRQGLKTVPELMAHCVRIVSVGRLCWIEGTNQTGKDNCAWYLFDARHTGSTEFIPRQAA
jgi:hypothetical protein